LPEVRIKPVLTNRTEPKMSGIRESALGGLCALVIASILVAVPDAGFTEGEARMIGRPVVCDASQAAPTEGKWGALIAAYNGCGQELFRAFAEEPGNIALSPYSIGTAMAMALVGARGENALEMAKVLGLQLPAEKIDAANAGVLASLNEASPASFQLHAANALMLTQQGGVISKDYAADLQHNYAAEVFRGANLTTVNDWVKQKTAGKIDSILDRLDPSAALVLLNAIYLKAPWLRPFDPRDTSAETFHLRQGTAEVPTMHMIGDFALAQRSGYRALRLLYGTGCPAFKCGPPQPARLAMIIVLPDKDLGDVVRRVDSEEMANVRAALRAPTRPVRVSLPRFHASFKASLVEPFMRMGMRRAFDPKTADFSGMTGIPQAKLPLAIDQIIHRAVIDVTEEGTEAAAATSVEVAVAGLRQPPSETFRVDRPFLFAIIDDATGAVLFEGRVADPRQPS
jgi:serpin B